MLSANLGTHFMDHHIAYVDYYMYIFAGGKMRKCYVSRWKCEWMEVKGGDKSDTTKWILGVRKALPEVCVRYAIIMCLHIK